MRIRDGISDVCSSELASSGAGGHLSAGWWLALRENRQLSVESTLEGGPRFAAGDIGGEVRVFVQHPRPLQPAQHRHHQQVTGAERAIEPVGVTKATGKLAQPSPDTVLEAAQADRKSVV